MPDVRDFVTRRHNLTETDPRRQALGSQHRVSVPQTKLHNIKPESSHTTIVPKVSIGSSLAGLGSEEIVADNNYTLDDGVDGFDTDAENFDDTDIMTISNKSQHQFRDAEARRQPFDYQKPAVDDGASHRLDSPFRTELDHHPDPRRSDQLESEDLGLSEDDDSSEDSGEEGSEASGSIDASIKGDLRSPGYSEYRKHLPHDRLALLQSTNSTASPIAHDSLALRLSSEDFQSKEMHNPFPSKRLTEAICMGKLKSQIHPIDRHILDQRRTQTHLHSHNEAQQIIPSQRAHQQWQKNHQYRANGAVGEAVKSHYQQAGSTLTHAHGSLIKARTNPEELKNEPSWPQAPSDKIMPVPVGSIGHVDDFSDVDQRESDANGSTVAMKGLRTRKRNSDLDHNLGDLSGMTFQQLSSEAFELRPQGGALEPSAGLVGPSLSDSLDRIFHLKDEEDKDSQRKIFFNSLSIEQYEECGDLMLERIGAVIAKFKDTRQHKRNVARDFEEEIARRYERMRGKEIVVEKDMSRLKRAGEVVVRGNSAEC